MVSKMLIHNEKDLVGVVTQDIIDGEEVEGVYMDTHNKIKLKAISPIPLGHKIALKDIKQNELVIEYGEPIGKATANIKMGEHVHTNNLKTMRW